MAQLRTVLILTAVILLTSAFSVSSVKTPCSYTDTVNLTGHHRFPDGSYLYGGTKIPANLTSIYKYTADIGAEKIHVKPHVRGCICKLKPCVQMCCPPGQIYNEEDNQCYESEMNYSASMKITTEKGLVNLKLTTAFVLKTAQPCKAMYPLLPDIQRDEYKLFENGTLLILDNLSYLNMEKYCLSFDGDYDTRQLYLVPVVCYPTTSNDARIKTKQFIYAIAMLCSIPFMLLTVGVYIALPTLRTLNGMSLCCYLMGLSVGYTILASFNVVSMSNVSQDNCSFFGFTAYFSFMSSFFWLSVISFDLYSKIRAIRRGISKTKRFIMYCSYAWGMAFIFLALTIYAQYASWINYEYKPAIGSDEYCWLNVGNGWSAMIYFYGPIIIIIGFNIVMFVLTSLQIRSVQKDMNQMMENNESQKKLHSEKARLTVFIRLFILMGVTWTTEIISYCVGSHTKWDPLFYITDILNSVQGFIIFVMFVLKRKIRKNVLQRLKSVSNSDRQGNRRSVNFSSQLNGTDKPFLMRSISTNTQYQ